MSVSSVQIRGESSHAAGSEVQGCAATLPPWTVHDRVNQFVIRFGVICWKPVEETRPYWKVAILPESRIPFQIKADDEELMVLDTLGDVYFKKSCEGKNTLMGISSWNKAKFDFPVITELFKSLVIRDPNPQASLGERWACSFMEKGAHYLDGAGKMHVLGEGSTNETTTAYVADAKNRLFRFFDPYHPQDPADAERLSLPYPETSQSYFEVRGCASSRSGLFCVGYDVAKAEGEGVQKKLTGYFISADANLLGRNPDVSYTYSQKEGFHLPASLYRQVSLPEKVTAVISIERLYGPAITDLVLTIQGFHDLLDGDERRNDVLGYFSKRLGDDAWTFTETKNCWIAKDELLDQIIFDPAEVFAPKVFDYEGKAVGKNHARLLNFGTHSLKVTVEVDTKDKKARLALYPHETHWNSQELDKIEFTLVVPQEELALLNLNEDATLVYFQQSGHKLKMYRKEDGKKLFEFRLKEASKEIS